MVPARFGKKLDAVRDRNLFEEQFHVECKKCWSELTDDELDYGCGDIGLCKKCLWSLNRMKITYDPDSDTLMVHLGNVATRGVKGKKFSSGDAYFDLSKDGVILSIEISGASKKYPMEDLKIVGRGHG